MTRSFARLFASPAATIGIVALSALAAVAAGAPLLAANDPLDIAGMPFLWPGEDAQFPLGTDMVGRDILAGLIYGARAALGVGLLAGGVATLAGLALGAAAGYFGGWVDTLLMRLAEFFQITPSLLLTITIVAVLGSSMSNIVFGIAVTSWPQVARLVRAEALRVRASDYVSAGLVMGFRDTHILLRHVLPNVVGPAIVMLSVLAGNAILTEAALSFLGLGDPNGVSWGSMIGAGREVLRTAWYMTAIPGTAIFATVLGLSLLGNGLNDLLNPRRGVAD